jgi:predicted membrane protein
MKKSVSNVMWGLALIILGILLAGDVLGIIDFHLFFKGWWTLFIIVPCFIGLLENKDKTGYIIGLGIGIMLLLSSQDIVSFHIMGRLIWPFILVIVGLSLLGRSISNRRQDKIHQYQEYQKEATGYNDYSDTMNNNSNNTQSNNSSYNSGESQDSVYREYRNSANQGLIKTYNNILSGRTIGLENEEFYGANINSILGGMDLDLRRAIITRDVVIEATCILGGVDIYVPSNVKVSINCTPILGGVGNKSNAHVDGNYPIIYINATCVLGGMDVK